MCQRFFLNENFVLQSEEDLAYEEEILRNPYSVKHWLRYCEFKKDAPPAIVNFIYERALKEMPGRYCVTGYISLDLVLKISF